jgi:hypothetical protein
MTRTKKTPIHSKYSNPSKTPLYRHTDDKIDHSRSDRTPNYILPLARRRVTYQARKAKWEAENPSIPYPHSPPEAVSRRGAAGRK